MSKFSMGVNPQGVETVVETLGDGTIITQDRQSPEVVQAIMDKCSEYRQIARKHEEGQMTLYASIPVVIYTNWRRDWDANYREYMNWDEYSWRMLNRPEYAQFKCTDEVLECPQEVKERGDHASVPQFMTAANCQRWRAERKGVSLKHEEPHFIPLTGYDDSARVSL